MFAQLPYDYIQHIDRGDRIRRSRVLGGRVRRQAGR